MVKIKSKRIVKNATLKNKFSIGGSYNLIVTFNPNHTKTADKELRDVLGKIGETPKIALTQSDGVLKAKVSDSRRVTSRLKKLCQADPNLFQMTHRYMPIDSWCKSEVKAMQQLASKAAKSIGESEKWKVSVEKRLWNKMDETMLIKKLTANIEQGDVHLEKPATILLVEIIGREAGVSLLKPAEIFNVNDLKSS